jgi:hypothetical protein
MTVPARMGAETGTIDDRTAARHLLRRAAVPRLNP